MDEREQTYINLKENLRKFGKSALVRGTGFGKSYMLVRLCGEYKNVLFLYPNAKLKNEVMKNYNIIHNDGKGKLDYESNVYYRVNHEDGFEGIMTPQEMMRYCS